MIPRAKYRSAPQSPQHYNKTIMSTFAAEEHKLINYLDTGMSCPANRKQSISSTKDCKETDLQGARNPMTPTGALVSAGFQVQLSFFISKPNLKCTRNISMIEFQLSTGISDSDPHC